MAQDYGFKYAKFKKNLDKKDPHDIGYTSGSGTLKSYISGKISVTCNAFSYATVEVPHGFNYRPGFNGYFSDPVSGEVYEIASGFEDVGFGREGASAGIHMSSNNYNLVFKAYNNTASTKSIDIFFEAFYEDLVSEPIFIPFNF